MFYNEVLSRSFSDPSKQSKLPHDFLSLLPGTPLQPFPVIEECSLDTQEQANKPTCNLSTAFPVNITCSVFNYFPDITLQFWHTSAILPSLIFTEINNTDWTRNKSVSITASADDAPYICVATDIPGYDEREELASRIYIYELHVVQSTTQGTSSVATIFENNGSMLHDYHFL